MKHVAIDFHFIRDQVQTGSLRVSHVSSEDQLADVLTKPLPRTRSSTQNQDCTLPSSSILRRHNRASQQLLLFCCSKIANILLFLDRKYLAVEILLFEI